MSSLEIQRELAAKTIPFDVFLSARSLVAKQKEGTRIFEMARDTGLTLHRDKSTDLQYQLAKLLAISVDIDSYAGARHLVVIRELAKVEDGLDADSENTLMSVEGLAKKQDRLLFEKSLIMKAMHLEEA